MGYTLQDAARHVGVWPYEIEAAEEGADYLTMRQAEALAKFYARPLAVLFMREPPAEEPPETQFRRLPGAPSPPWPPAMHALIRRVRERQEAAVELFDVLDDESAWTTAAPRLRIPDLDDIGGAARVVRAVLGVSLDDQAAWKDPDGYVPLHSWIDAVEALGVFVMQDGHLPVEQMRGFAALHDSAPVIVVNTKDDPRARSFTLIHELGHLVRLVSGAATGDRDEAWCDEFAGLLLMPYRRFKHAWDEVEDQGSTLSGVNRVALYFGVTPLAAAVRLARYELVPRAQADEIIAAIRNRETSERSPGGDYYRNKVVWLGPAFIRLVFDAADAQAVTLSNAAGLLEVKVNQFDRLRTTVEGRAAA